MPLFAHKKTVPAFGKTGTDVLHPRDCAMGYQRSSSDDAASSRCSWLGNPPSLSSASSELACAVSSFGLSNGFSGAPLSVAAVPLSVSDGVSNAFGLIRRIWSANHAMMALKTRCSHDGFLTTMTRATRTTLPFSYTKPRRSTCMIVLFSIAGFGQAATAS